MGHSFKVRKGYMNAISDLYGQVDSTEKQIRINEKTCTTKDQEASTLLHEVIHAVDFLLKIGLNENAVSRLASGLYASGVRVKMEVRK